VIGVARMEYVPNFEMDRVICGTYDGRDTLDGVCIDGVWKGIIGLTLA
jgi:hypothetical protein